MGRWLIWGAVLIVSHGFNALASRARTTTSYWYHGLASALNHGTWYIANFMFVGTAIQAKTTWDLLFAFVFYTSCATCGSAVAHYLSINYFERREEP